MHSIDYFRRSDWTGLKRHVDGLAPQAAYSQIVELAFASPLDSSLDGLIDGPHDVLGRTIAGGIGRYRAKRIRGPRVAGGAADHTLEPYSRRFAEATSQLWAAIAVDPHHGLAAAFLASAAAEFHPEEIDEVETLLVDAAAVPASAFVELLSARTWRRGGSQEDMWAVAERYRAWSRPGTLALVARAHFEQHTFLALFGEGPTARSQARAYYRGLEVREALIAASEEVLNPPADADPYALRLADGWLARTLVAAGQGRAARAHLRRLRGHVDPTVWTRGVGLPPWGNYWLTRVRAALLPG